MSASMFSRRSFLFLAAAAIPGMALSAEEHTPLGAQLYTVRQMAQADLASTLKQIRAIGYEEVELYEGVYRRPQHELQEAIARSGLRATSGHFAYEGFAAQLPLAKALGLQWMVVGMLPRSQQNLIDGYHRAAQAFNRWGKLCQDRGMRFAFHNHNYEFADLKGTTGYDVLLKETDPELVFLEMDAYWLAQAGRDPVLMMNQLGKRVQLLHLKDRKAGEPTSQELNESAGHFTEVGRGTIHWRELLLLAQRNGVQHYFVEQDTAEKPLESLKTSYDNLRRMIP